MSKNFILLIVVALVFSVISALALGINISGSSGIGYIIGNAIGTVGAAMIISLIPAGIYWLATRKPMPGLSIVIWVLWGLIAAISLTGNLMYLARTSSF